MEAMEAMMRTELCVLYQSVSVCVVLCALIVVSSIKSSVRQLDKRSFFILVNISEYLITNLVSLIHLS